MKSTPLRVLRQITAAQRVSSLRHQLHQRPRHLHHHHRPTVNMADHIHRVTLFKVPKEEDQKKLADFYKVVCATNQKPDGKPYIISLIAGPAEVDTRSQGYTVAAKSEFASLEDMKYYDTECPAHKNLKAFVKTLTVEGIMTVYFKAQVSAP